jgi:hypothetical protein
VYKFLQRGVPTNDLKDVQSDDDIGEDDPSPSTDSGTSPDSNCPLVNILELHILHIPVIPMYLWLILA